MKQSELKSAIEDLLKESDSDLFLFSAGIDTDQVNRLIQIVNKKGNKRATARLFITTNGGDPDAAYRLAACLKRSYTSFAVYVFGMCKSAGTLAVLGAKEVIFGDSGELGPLDVQLSKRDELIGSSSGLDILQAIGVINNSAFESFESCMIGVIARSGGTISAQMAADIATQMATGLFSPLTAQIDPERLGEVQRAINIANAYGDRLNSGNLKSGALERLVQGYPSHSFVIDQGEAAQLFNSVRPANAKEALVAEGISAIRQLGRTPIVLDLEAAAIQMSPQGAPNASNPIQPPTPPAGAHDGAGGSKPDAPAVDRDTAGDSQAPPQDGNAKKRRDSSRAATRKRGIAKKGRG